GLVFLFAAALLGGGYLAASSNSVIAGRWQSIIGKGQGWERIFSGEGDFRLSLAKEGIGIWQQAPWFGHGPASFDLEHLRVSTWTQGSRALFTHNDYVNTLCDYGAVGTALAALFWIFLAVFLWRRARTRGEGSKADACTALGWALMAVMLIHAFVDFNYHIPANAISCFLLLGLATTVSWPERQSSWARVFNPILIVLALFLAGATGWHGWRTWAGWNSLPEKSEQAAKLTEKELADAALQAERWDPRSPVLANGLGDAYRLKLLDIYFSPPSPTPESRASRKQEETRLAEASIHWYAEAEKRSPKDDTLCVRRASVLDLQGKFPEAEILYLQGLQMRPHAKFFHLSYGNHLWRKGDLAGAVKSFEKAIALPALHRPGDEKDPAEEAREMLAQVKEQIANSGKVRQVRKFNPRED
ncbi:MAG: O-antigen ligase family protein, partial [Verrucomicrobia bacterium]|nr:O-antigen ligase family protein [Verrucomicrobiota bacterium]